MRSSCSARRLAVLVLGLLFVGAPGALAQTPAFPLQVSEDGRRLIDADGQPFFWLGDTAWELFHRLDREEAEQYLADRARKGFTVVQAVVLAELDGLRTPNAYGHLPLEALDPTRPNEAYFEHVDAVVDRAATLGLVMGMLPTWGDKFNRKWGVGPEVFTPANARVYGAFLGARYRDRPVVWILGGDRNPEEPDDLAITRALAEGIESAAGEGALMTYHPQGASASWQWFHDDAWIDFHVFQSGHGAYDTPNHRRTEEGYALTPVRPVFDAEPRYEDHPVNWQSDEGWFGAFDVRQAAYWSVLAGAAGHTYGNHNIWQMWAPGRDPISQARTPWTEALAHPGATQMGMMHRLFRSRPFLQLVPAQEVLVDGAGEGASHRRAARDASGRTLIAYTPYGQPLTVNLSGMSGETLRAWWFDPRTGAATEIGTFPRSPARLFDPPGSEARGNDWVLVVDDAAAGFAAPGAGVIAG